jgi:hypothetical protein
MSAREAARRQPIALEVQDLIVPAETTQELLQLFEAPNHGRHPQMSPIIEASKRCAFTPVRACETLAGASEGLGRGGLARANSRLMQQLDCCVDAFGRN